MNPGVLSGLLFVCFGSGKLILSAKAPFSKSTNSGEVGSASVTLYE